MQKPHMSLYRSAAESAGGFARPKPSMNRRRSRTVRTASGRP
jgi:hypothetical protein